MLTQRLGSATQKDPKFIDALIEQIQAHPGCCDEVWLATDYGFPPMDVHRAAAETLKGAAEKFRKIGVRVSLQLSNSIGHGQYMSAQDCSGLVYEGSPVEKMTGQDGTVADYCFCWNGEHFRRYVLEQIRIYAEAIRPACVWVDDDLRAENHNPVDKGCFCDGCIARFNRLHGAAFTRETLVEAVDSELVWREKYVDFVREGLGDFVYELSKAVHEGSPETRMGYQYTPYGGYTGPDFHYVFDAMRRATGLDPASRPGGGAYDDHDPNAFIAKGYAMSALNAMLPEYVTEIRPEIENLPDVMFGKSIAGTCFETDLYMAMGSTAMSYAMLMEDYEPMAWHGRMLDAFAARRSYWMRLSELNRRTGPAGARVFTPAEAWKQPVNPGDAPLAWARPSDASVETLLRFGVPLSRADGNGPVVLRGEQAALLSDAEIESLLRRPVFTDGLALETLQECGYSFSAKAEPCDVSQLYEEMLDHPVNGVSNKPMWSQSFYVGKGHFLTDVTGKTQFFTGYASRSRNAKKHTDDPDRPYGMAAGIVETARGAEWAVFGNPPWAVRSISHDRREQLLSALDFISQNALPARLETPWQAIVLPREDGEGNTAAVSIVNCTIGVSDRLTVRIRRPSGKKFFWQTPTGEPTELTKEYDGEDAIVILPPMQPWSVGTVFAE